MKKYLLLITLLFCALTTFSQNSFPSEQGRPVIKLEHSSDGVNAFGWLEFNDMNSRMGYVGFGSSGNNTLHFSNETGGDFSFLKGDVGIGTTNPEEKLHVNGDLYLFGNKVDENNWGLTNFYWKGHTLRMGSKEGRYSHNKIELKPGGSDRGTLYSNIQMFNALDVGVHEQTVNISSYANHDSYINAGNFGIGTNDPEEKLHVNGDLYLFGNKVDENNWGLTNFYWKGHTLRMGSKEGRYSHNKIELKPGGSDRGTLYSNIQMFNALDVGVHEQTVNISSYANHDSYINAGDFGIGTNDPQAKLHVNGNILASEVTVSTAADVPDYVFKDDYKLTSLAELEKYIQENHHLPEIPSAEEVEAEGLHLAQMNLLLLKKIEELTLHTIEQEKKLGKQDKQISELTKMVLTLYENQASNE